MPAQFSDAPARNIKGYWLGDPNSGIRFWFDAEYRAWILAVVLYLPLVGVLWLVVPVGVLAVGAIVAAYRVTKTKGPERLYRVPGTRRVRHAFADLAAGATFIVALGLIPPRFLLFPMPWWVAVVCGVIATVLTTRAITPWMDPNRPLAYWLATMQRVASGPRRRRQLVDTAHFDDNEAVETTALQDIHLLGLTTEAAVTMYVPIAVPVEACQWLPNDTDAQARMSAWLQSHGMRFHVDRDGWLVLPDVELDGERRQCLMVRPKRWLMRNAGEGWAVVDDRRFRRGWREASAEVTA